MSERRLFLSYRREDSAGHAGRLADHLLDRFSSGSVFMDVESIGAGADFTTEIESAIGQADAVLVLIGPGWLEARTASGSRRLNEPEDFVRREIEVALASEVWVIPVLVGGASMPAETELPESIAPLARRNALELLDRRWREDVDALVDVLEGRERGGIGNLPVQPTPFLGRERELAELTELLRRQEVRMLTLTGPGGIGKTRLAIQAAAKLAHTYPGGTWFVGLASLTDPDLILAEIARVLEVRETAEDQLASAIADRVSSARTLMILDNLEQLLPGAAGPIAELCAAAPALDLLASSREPLRISTEREVPVPALSEQEAEALFIQQARAADPAFALHDEAERTAVAQVCERLDRLPLAIELAAARTRLLRPVTLLQRLDQRLPLLTGGARDLPERQRTLRATIAWSYDLLSEVERELFERLAAFSSGWTLEAAEAVCGADLDTLQSLVERSLVRVDGSRFLILETIREFALECLEARSDAEEVRRRHADYFLEVAEAAGSAFRGPDQAVWLDRLATELDNHRTAIRWALEGADPELGMRLVVKLWFGSFQIAPAEHRQWLSEALERTPRVASEVRATALWQAAFLASEQGEDATHLLEESIRNAREVGAVTVEATAMSNLASVLPADRAPEAIPLGLEAVRLARSSGDRRVLAHALNNLSEAYRESGEIGPARTGYEESLALYREVGHGAAVALVLTNLAEVALIEGDLSRCRAFATEALQQAEAHGVPRLAAMARDAIGWVELGDGQPDAAAAHFRAGLELYGDLRMLKASVGALFGLAGAAAAEGRTTRAARLWAAAERWEQALGHAPTAADSGIHRRYLDELRAATDPTAWEAETRVGESMSLDEAIAYALHPDDT